MATGSTAGVIGQLNDPQYLNWIKAKRALHVTMEALRSFCRDQMNDFHQLLQLSCGRTRCSVPCTSADITYDRNTNAYSVNCPNNVCSQWLTDIASERATRRARLTVDNCDISQWPVEPWQVAKAFMNSGQDRSSVNPSDNDASGILNLLVNCRFFIPLVDKRKTHAVQATRNSVMQTSTMKVTTTKLSAYILTMTALLQDSRHLINDPVAQHAVMQVQQIQTTPIDVSDAVFIRDEGAAWKQILSAAATQHRQDIQMLQNEIAEERIMQSVAAIVPKTPLLLDGATLTARPKSSISSRHQTTKATGSSNEYESTSEVAATVLKTPLLLDGATLTARPKSSVSSRHQTTKATGSNNEYEATSEDSSCETPRKRDETLRDAQTPPPLPCDTPVEPHRRAVRLVASRNMIMVSGIKETTTEKLLKMFFQSKKRSGGGPVKDIDYQHTKGQATITFHSDEDAENVLGKPEFKLEGATLSVSLVEEWDRRTIEVHGIHPSSSYDVIKLFFESKHRSGGNTVEHMEFDTASNIAYVTFESPEVAATVLKTPFLLDGATLTVRPKSSISSRHQQTTGETDCNKEHESTSKDLSHETPRKHDETLCDPQTPTRLPRDTPVELPRHAARLVASRNMITVSGIKDTTTEELLKMFFQSKKRSDGGPVKDIDYRHTKGQATITFHSDEDAKRVLQCGVLSLEEAKLTITSMMVEETTPERECKPSQSCAFTDASSVHILEISGFKPGTGREIVEMFIENKTRETELQSLDYDTTTGVAVVALKNAQGTTQLETGNLQLGGVQLSVSALSHVCAGLDPESCQPRAIQVHGLCKNTSAETLELFFENTRACDGGDIEQLDYDDEEGTAVIVFKDADTASRVAQKKPLNLAGKSIQVKLMRPSASVPIVEGPFEDNLVLVSGLSPKCTGDDLETFFSAEKTHSEIQHVIFSLHPGVAMLQFTHPPEFDRLRELCVAKPLRGTMVNVQRVPQSKTIQVHNIGEITEEILNLYFENKCGRDGRVITVDVLRQDDYALIEFANCASAQNILARTSHQLENHRLFVSIYHTCLGLISPYHVTTMPGGWIPKNVFVTGFCPRVFNFLQTYGVSRQLVNTKMTEVAAVVEWDTYNDASTCVELTCVITHRMKDAQTKAKTWSQDASKAFQDVLARNFVADKIETLQKAWTPFLERIGYVSDLDRSKIAVAVCAEECSVSITGPRKEVDSVSAKLKDDHSKVQEEMEKAATIVTETKRGFTLHHLRMLNANAFKSQQEKKFADLTVEIDMASLEVRFTGMPGDIITAVSEMLGILNNIAERCLKMSVSLISMLQGKPMMKLVVAQFRDQNICAVYGDVGDNRLRVYALSDEHLDTAIEVIKATTCEKSVSADVNKLSAPQKWIELIDAQQSEHDGFLTITESENTVVLVGEKSHVEDSLKEIHTFLEVNIISEQFVAMEYWVASYIDRYMVEEIGEVMKTYLHVTLTVKLDGNCGYVVAGNTNSVQRIVQDLQRWQDDIKMQQFPVDKPGLPKFLTSGPGQHSLQQLEQQHKVVVEPVGRYAQKGEELASDAGASAAGSSSMSRVTLPGGVTVEVIRGDLTKFHADAIVNAANVRLDHKRGLAKAIVHAGGQEIQRECLDYVHQWGGDIAEGNVYVSTSGSLPCKKVIHVVSPVWKGGRNSEEKMLYDAVYESLLTAEKHRLSSVALPALSSETGFPIAALTDTLVNALKDFLHAQSQSCVKKVSLVDLKDSVVRAFCMSLVPAFGPRKVVTGHGGQDKSQFSSSYYLMTGHDGQDKSQKKGARPTSHTDTRRQAEAQPHSGWRHTPSSGRHHVSTRREQTSAPQKTQLNTPEGITLSLCKSEIAKEQVDAIVNSTNRSLHLNTGIVSRTLLQNGGNNIQTECLQNAPNGIQYGKVVVTSGGRLNCQYIVHGACPRWDGGSGQSEQALRQLIANCLDTVHSMGLTSIAIPAIGTGKLHFPHQLVATAMLDELRKFSSYNPQTSLKDVRFVVYQKDHQTIKAFEDVLFSSETDLHRRTLRPARAPARHGEAAQAALERKQRHARGSRSGLCETVAVSTKRDVGSASTKADNAKQGQNYNCVAQ